MLYQQFYAVNPTTGAAIAGCQVGVYDYSNALTSLFDQNGNPIANPVTADSTGKVGFAAADGVYSYRFMVGSTVVAAILTVQIVDALALKASVAAEATRAETAEYDLGLDVLAEAARAQAAEGALGATLAQIAPPSSSRAPNVADGPTTYAVGFSVCRAETSRGWPLDGFVSTILSADGSNPMQMTWQYQGQGPIEFRTFDGTANAWTAWRSWIDSADTSGRIATLASGLTAAKLPTDAISTYGLGLSIYRAVGAGSDGSTWPVNGFVVTFREAAGSTYGYQVAYDYQNDQETFTRVWTIGGWGKWRTGGVLNRTAVEFSPTAAQAVGTYPLGVSLSRATAANGWPLEGYVETIVQIDGGYGMQVNWPYQATSTQVQTRTWSSTNNGWNAWANSAVPTQNIVSNDVTGPPYPVPSASMTTYPLGISIRRAQASDGWPLDGWVVTTREATVSLYAFQEIWSYNVDTPNQTRNWVYGSPAAWGAWHVQSGSGGGGGGSAPSIVALKAPQDYGAKSDGNAVETAAGGTNDSAAVTSLIAGFGVGGESLVTADTFVGAAAVPNTHGKFRGPGRLYYQPDGVLGNRGNRVQNPLGRDTYAWGQEYLFAPLTKAFNGGALSILFSGDSTTAYSNSYAAKLATIIGAKNPTYTTTNRGQAGKGTQDWVNTYLSGDIAVAPDIFFWHWGMNPGLTSENLATFETYLRQGLTTLRQSLPISQTGVVLMTPNACVDGPDGRDEARNERIREIIRNAAVDFGCAFFDTYALWQDAYQTGMQNTWFDKPYSDNYRVIHPQDPFTLCIAGKVYDEFVYPRGFQLTYGASGSEGATVNVTPASGFALPANSENMSTTPSGDGVIMGDGYLTGAGATLASGISVATIAAATHYPSRYAWWVDLLNYNGSAWERLRGSINNATGLITLQQASTLVCSRLYLDHHWRH